MGTCITECTCPCCRHNRGEISDEAYAWYLKGSIEYTANFIRLAMSAPSLDALKKKVGRTQYDLDCSVEDLNIVLAKGNVSRDPALIHPFHYVIPDDLMHDDQNTTDISDPINIHMLWSE